MPSGSLRRFYRLALLASFGWALPGPAPAAVTLEVTGLSPAPPAILLPRSSFYARVSYDSDQPIRLQARGGLAGAEAQADLMNASPVYPAGHGEALVWIAYNAGRQIDEIKAVAYDRQWRRLGEASSPVQASWNADGHAPVDEAWVATLQAESQGLSAAEARATEASPGSKAGTSLVGLMMLAVPAYLALQAWALWKLRSRRRLIAAIPILLMGPVYVFSIYSLGRGSNLWPLAIIFVSPVGLGVLVSLLYCLKRQV